MGTIWVHGAGFVIKAANRYRLCVTCIGYKLMRREAVSGRHRSVKRQMHAARGGQLTTFYFETSQWQAQQHLPPTVLPNYLQRKSTVSERRLTDGAHVIQRKQFSHCLPIIPEVGTYNSSHYKRRIALTAGLHQGHVWNRVKAVERKHVVFSHTEPRCIQIMYNRDMRCRKKLMVWVAPSKRVQWVREGV